MKEISEREQARRDKLRSYGIERARKLGQRIAVDKACEKCGKIFKAHKDNSKYCSRECQKIYANPYERGKATAETYRQRRIALRTKAIAYKGGCCQACGYNACMQALEFHHNDPREKEGHVVDAGYKILTWEEILPELEKCTLLCANCHRWLHVMLREAGQKQINRGGRRT